MSSATPGPDHAAAVPSVTERLRVRLASMRKALVAFLVGGGGAAIVDQFGDGAFLTWTPAEIGRALVVGLLSGVSVYLTRNRS